MAQSSMLTGLRSEQHNTKAAPDGAVARTPEQRDLQETATAGNVYLNTFDPIRDPTVDSMSARQPLQIQFSPQLGEKSVSGCSSGTAASPALHSAC